MLGDELGQAATGRPRVVWVEGESGIGKTQLVRRFLARAPEHLLVSASGEEGEAPLRFGVVDQILADLPGTVPDGPAPGAVADPDVDALVVGADLLALLGSLDDRVVLVVDDLQWVDLASARALLFLLRRLQAEPMLVILISQPDPGVRLGSGWARLLADPDRVTWLGLEGLAADELAELAVATGRDRLGQAPAQRLHDHTGGHPLHARAFLEEFGVAGLRSASGVLPAPRPLAGVILTKVEALASPTQHLVAAGAVLGHSFAPEVAAMVAGVADPVLAVESATAAGLLDRRPDGSVAFSHPLVRSGVYDGWPPAGRRDLHVAAATVTSGAVSLQHRVAAATGPDADLVEELTALAAVEADRADHVRAADHLEAAARLVEDAPTRELLLLGAVELVHTAGDFVRAEAMRPLVEGCAEGLQRTYVLGLLDFAVDDLARAEQRLAETVAVDEGGDTPWRARAATTLALTRLRLGDWEGARAAAEVATGGDQVWDRSVAQFAVVFSLAQLGRMDEAWERTRLASSALAPGDPGWLDVQASIGLARTIQGDDVAAVEDLTAVCRAARAGTPMRLHELALADLADSEHRLGRWDDALLHAELAASLARDGARGAAQVRALTVLARVSAGRGRFAAAEGYLDEVDSLPGARDSRLARIQVAMARAAMADAQDDPAGVHDALAVPFDGQLRGAMAAIGPVAWRAALVGALLGGGRLDDAAEALDHLRSALADQPRATYHATTACLAGGRLAEARGDDRGALAAYEQGPASHDVPSSRCPALAALRLARGRLHARLDHRRRAIDDLRAAREIYLALGADPFVARCDADLARCGLPTHPRAATDPLQLTDAEMRVAQLVADGLTNRETASRLYVSPKTVEFHLANVYAKLGVRSRRDLPARMGAVDG